MATLPIVKREISIKNTFIVADEGEEQAAIEIHQCGARTCVARISDDATHCNFGEDGISVASDESPSIESAFVRDRGLSDADTFASTPMGSECDFDIGHTTSSESTAIASATELPVRERISLDLSVPPAGRRQVMIQVPIKLPRNVESLPNGLIATVMHSHVVQDAECTTIDLRLALDGLATCSSAVSQPLTACSPPAIQACTPSSWPLGTLAFPILKTPSQPSKISTPADKAVCCHWKNKGWCKYQQSCKFLHPEHKRGVGSLKMAVPFPLCRMDRRRL